jgi:hypothetical protein
MVRSWIAISLTISLAISLAISLTVCTMACASSTGRSGQWETFGADFDLVWEAAVMAVQDIGARLISTNRQSGVILGRMSLDTTGSLVNIDITVSHYVDSGEVRVKVLYPDREGDQTSGMLAEDATALEELYLEAVRGAIRDLHRMRR